MNKVMRCDKGKDKNITNLKVEGCRIQKFEEFYVISKITKHGQCNEDIQSKLAQTRRKL